MMENIIAFPGLGLEWTINRVAFNVFGKDIFWYGIIICAGFLLASLYIASRADEFHLPADDEINMLLIGIPISILCARIYYVVFQWENYRNNLSEVFKIWHGGLAIYGGIIGAVLVIVVYCKVRRLSIADTVDITAFGLLIGQSIGRWGNFINAEAHGSETSLPWRMSINGAAGVHPTFFYESAWNALGFVLLHLHSKKRRFKGELFLEYIAWYGFGRMFIEGLRTDSLYLFGSDLRTSQVLACVSCVVAIYLIVRGYRAHPICAISTAIESETVTPEEGGNDK